MIKLIFKNDKYMSLLSFIYRERLLAFTFVSDLVERFKKIEREYYLTYQTKDIEISLVENDFLNLIERAESLKDGGDFRKNKYFTTDRTSKSFSGFYEHVQYLFLEDGGLYHLDIQKFKILLRENFSNISIDSPSFLAESIKINMKSKMDRELSINNNIKSESEFLTAIGKDRFKLTNLNSDLKVSGDYEFKAFSENLLESLSSEVEKISTVNIALKYRTVDILESIKETSIERQLNFINKYLNSTKETLSNFFDGDSSESMNMYIQKAEQYFKLVGQFKEEWRSVRYKYETEKVILIDTIYEVLYTLQGVEENLRTKGKIEKFMMRFDINDTWDSSALKASKNLDFKEFFFIKNDLYLEVSKSAKPESHSADIINFLKNDLEERMKERVILTADEIIERKRVEKENDKIERDAAKVKLAADIRLSSAHNSIYTLLNKKLRFISKEHFRRDSRAEMDKLILNNQDYIIELFGKEAINDNRVLYRSIEKLYYKEFSNHE
ncbi:MAG TPA: hypothetical protein EYG89_06440 [Bacteroidia bacterium]|nr:hypothetical protein [Bacteroidia bacterium]